MLHLINAQTLFIPIFQLHVASITRNGSGLKAKNHPFQHLFGIFLLPQLTIGIGHVVARNNLYLYE